MHVLAASGASSSLLVKTAGGESLSFTAVCERLSSEEISSSLGLVQSRNSASSPNRMTVLVLGPACILSPSSSASSAESSLNLSVGGSTTSSSSKDRSSFCLSTRMLKNFLNNDFVFSYVFKNTYKMYIARSAVAKF